MFFGLLFLSVSLVSDPVKFFVNLYKEPRSDDYMDSVQGLKISRESLNLFEDACLEIVDKLGEPGETTFIHFK